jgi:hypothetical protein
MLPLDARGRTLSQAPFLEDDAALPFDLCVRDRGPRGEVAHGQQTLVQEPRLVGGDVEHVDRLVERGVGVGVGAEAGSNRFQVGHQLAGLEVRAAVEVHVLDEMGQPALVFFLQDGPGLGREAEGDAVLRAAVPADVIGQPVGQLARPDRRVEGERLIEADGSGAGRGGAAGAVWGKAVARSAAARNAAATKRARCLIACFPSPRP